MALLHHLDKGASKPPGVRRVAGYLCSLAGFIVMEAGMDIADISSQMQVVMLDAGNRPSIADTGDGGAGGNRRRKAKVRRWYI